MQSTSSKSGKEEKKGYCEEALKIFHGMQTSHRDKYMYTSMLSAYASKGEVYKMENY